MESLEPTYFDGEIDESDIHSMSLPHDEEAERSVLAVLLKSNDTLDEMDHRLAEDDFYTPRHRLIYRHILRLRGSGRPADTVTVANELGMAGELDQAGGKDYLLDLYDLGEINTNFAEYVQLVRDKSMLRRLRNETAGIQHAIHNPQGRNCSTILEDAETKIFQMSDDYSNRRQDSIQRIDTVVSAVNDQVNELYERIQQGGSPITGVETNFNILDMYTSGLQPSDLVIIAARPSIGKTAFALDMVRNVCSRADNNDENKHKHAVALFSLEMSASQITKRMIGAQGKLDQYVLRSGQLTEARSWETFSRSIAEIEKWPFWIDDTAILSVTELRSRARRIKRKCENEGTKLQMIVVDYLQLMVGDDSNNSENRAVEVSMISRGLKSLAREMQVPVVALSQMSRKIEDRTSRRPQLSDLRDSGGIEQDADLIMFLSRKPKDPGDTSNIDDIELIIGKHRNGPTGDIQLRFDRRYTTFKEVDGQQPYDPNVSPEIGSPDADADDYTFNA